MSQAVDENNIKYFQLKKCMNGKECFFMVETCHVSIVIRNINNKMFTLANRVLKIFEEFYKVFKICFKPLLMTFIAL